MIDTIYNAAAIGNGAATVFFIAKALWYISMSETLQAQLHTPKKNIEKKRMRYKRYPLGAVGTTFNAVLFANITQ